MMRLQELRAVIRGLNPALDAEIEAALAGSQAARDTLEQLYALLRPEHVPAPRPAQPNPPTPASEPAPPPAQPQPAAPPAPPALPADVLALSAPVFASRPQAPAVPVPPTAPRPVGVVHRARAPQPTPPPPPVAVSPPLDDDIEWDLALQDPDVFLDAGMAYIDAVEPDARRRNMQRYVRAILYVLGARLAGVDGPQFRAVSFDLLLDIDRSKAWDEAPVKLRVPLSALALAVWRDLQDTQTPQERGDGTSIRFAYPPQALSSKYIHGAKQVDLPRSGGLWRYDAYDLIQTLWALIPGLPPQVPWVRHAVENDAHDKALECLHLMGAPAERADVLRLSQMRADRWHALAAQLPSWAQTRGPVLLPAPAPKPTPAPPAPAPLGGLEAYRPLLAGKRVTLLTSVRRAVPQAIINALQLAGAARVETAFAQSVQLPSALLNRDNHLLLVVSRRAELTPPPRAGARIPEHMPSLRNIAAALQSLMPR